MIVFFYLVMCFIFGTTFLFIKMGLGTGWSPFLFSSLRFILAGWIIIGFLQLFSKKVALTPSIHSQIARLSFFMTTVPFAALYWSEQYISSGEAAVIVATSPLFILVINHFTKQERINSLRFIGSLISLGGIGLLFFNEISIDSNSESAIAKFVLLLAEWAFAYGSIQSKKVLIELKNPFILNGYQMLYGGSFLMVISQIFNEDYSLPAEFNGWLILIYFILFASILSSGIFYWLIKHTSVYFSTTWTYVSPLIALLLGSVFLKEDIGHFGLLGAVLILGGILLTNTELFKRKQDFKEGRKLDG
ncbi:EamA family transporter [Bacillus sp. JJ1609]|uniref:DMT family transporter n=1 Tax=Bacillus sp. JJ1609 TaxID=3122977 RepID=UPI0030000EBA